MKNIRIFLSETFHFWLVKISVYLNRLVFVMWRTDKVFDVVVLSFQEQKLIHKVFDLIIYYVLVVRDVFTVDSHYLEFQGTH